MTFVFDIDDTISDTDGYSEKYIKEFFKENNLPYKQIATNTRFAEKKFDWDSDIALNWYLKYGDDMMSKFPLVKGAKEVLDVIHNTGNKIVIATARANDWHIDPEGVTFKWLEDNEIPYDECYIGRVDKELICEEQKAGVFVDDDVKITARVAQHHKGRNKIKVYLMTSGYNKDFEVPEGVERAKDFYDLAKKLNIVVCENEK